MIESFAVSIHLQKANIIRQIFKKEKNEKSGFGLNISGN
ncbi:hypothetical protein ATCC51562_7 [Campylobacter concisus ATCC 51562]|uniref:Uncharacterized protein n=1 Tax=Campylobacter concisus ATCC 51562 TaxID=1242969 RepID=U2GJB9_9BACT|nr:hypothetical protein ATCC51562_7 [Campylobacter concisus ATCC 51562]